MPQKCSGCGVEIPEGSKLGACPKCLMAIGLEAGPGQTPGSVKFDSLGDYEVIGEIARGGMGVVYKARQKSLNRLVAVKTILFGPKANADFIKRFRIEASAAAALQHPNIVAIHEVGVHEGEHFLVMDYVDGPTLAELAKNQPLSAERAARYLRKVAEAIHHAHEKGILHRDLKPSNVLIDSNDEPRVTDFGLAKRLGTDSQTSTDVTQLTLSGHVLGSPCYIPPEQAIGARGKMSRRSDVYSLGAMLYHLLTGRPPFGGSSMADTLYQVQHQEPISLRLLNPGVPFDLETICLKCLEKEPGRRYQTAQELADELGRFLKDEPICARPVSRTERAWRWCRRHPQVAGLAVGIALLLFVVALGTPVALIRINREWRRAELSAGREAAERRRAERLLTRLEVQKAWELFGADDVSGGLAFLARVTRDDPSHQAAAERLLATLTQQGFTLPCVPPISHDDHVTVTRFSPDGRLLVTVTRGGSLRRWDSLTGALIGPPRSVWGEVNDVQFSPNGAWVVVAADKVAVVFDVRTGEQTLEPLSHDDKVHSASFSQDGELMLTTCQDGAVKVWEAKTGRLLTTMQHEGCAAHGRFSPDGRSIVTASHDHTARVWASRTGQAVSPLLRHNGAVYWAAFSPDGRRVLTASEDKTARVWDAVRGAEILPSLKHSGSVLSAEFSPDGSRIVTTSTDTKAWIWDARDGHALAEPLKHASAIGSARFSPDGERLVTASWDKTARVWDALLGQPLSEPLRHEGAVVSAEFSHDGLRVVTVSHPGDVIRTRPLRERIPTTPGTVRIWEVPRASLPVPAWLPMLAEAVAGQRLNEQHVMEPVSSDGLEEIRAQVPWHYVTNQYVAWAAWFFEDSPKRSVSPCCAIPLADYLRVMKIPTRDPMAANALIDLSLYYNSRLDHPRNPDAPQDHLGQMAAGVQRLAEVDFDVRGIVQLSGSTRLAGYYPSKVDDIRISSKAKRLHFLHAVKWKDPVGTHVATFVVHYAGGRRHSIPLVYGVNVDGWWTSPSPPFEPTHAIVAWTGSNAMAAAHGHTLRLFKMTWENPEPALEIRSLDFRSEGAESAPFLIAITAE